MTTDEAIAEHDRLSAIPEAELKLPQPKVEYYEGRTEGWDWFGTPRWWEKFIVWDNGNYYAFPDRRWPYMPIHEADFYRRVRDVRFEDLKSE